MNLPSILILIGLGLLFVGVIANEIRKKIQNKSSNSCGGCCGSCKGCHGCTSKQQDAQK